KVTPDVISVWTEILKAAPQARLALVGDGPHRQQLEKVFAGTATTFVGYLGGEELAGAYASADAFLFPSSTETLGLVLLEAMAAGSPVVAARRGGIPDIVTDGVNGCLYEPDGRRHRTLRIRKKHPRLRPPFFRGPTTLSRLSQHLRPSVCRTAGKTGR
ncbi:MAG: glycosyltransferase, partial [Verrucomicrobia bacterium]|nr:glycosyltransferase [Verrucomicrobiota bacterium]